MVLINSMFTGYIPSAFRVILDPSLEPLLERPDLWTTYVSMETIKPIEQATSWFCSMVGGEYDYFGNVDNQIKLNDMVFEFIEDEYHCEGDTALGAVYFPEFEPDKFHENSISVVKLETFISRDGMYLERGYLLRDVETKKVLFNVGTKLWTEDGTDYTVFFIQTFE